MDRTSGQPQVKPIAQYFFTNSTTGVDSEIDQINNTREKTKKAELRRDFIKGQIRRVWM
jgi:hypothetical protein